MTFILLPEPYDILSMSRFYKYPIPKEYKICQYDCRYDNRIIKALQGNTDLLRDIFKRVRFASYTNWCVKYKDIIHVIEYLSEYVHLSIILEMMQFKKKQFAIINDENIIIVDIDVKYKRKLFKKKISNYEVFMFEGSI